MNVFLFNSCFIYWIRKSQFCYYLSHQTANMKLVLWNICANLFLLKPAQAEINECVTAAHMPPHRFLTNFINEVVESHYMAAIRHALADFRALFSGLFSREQTMACCAWRRDREKPRAGIGIEEKWKKKNPRERKDMVFSWLLRSWAKGDTKLFAGVRHIFLAGNFWRDQCWQKLDIVSEKRKYQPCI